MASFNFVVAVFLACTVAFAAARPNVIEKAKKCR